ncbi:MAG TPA: phosphoribosylglycinamide formyltransferase [Burkholderiales bacterium]|nr:phosphoribosylglycinamide formyltransferase [Burkholderiales bacterium]
MTRIVVLISGRGSNMQALLESRLPAAFTCVISNVPDARGLPIAREHGVATDVVDHRRFSERAGFDTALGDAIDRAGADLVVLAGFMRILTPQFVERYRGRLLNIHPSLLPAFPGLDAHRRALQAGVRIHGCTVHFVTPQLDHGPIVVQAAVPVEPGDTEDALAARVLAQEHRIYPLAVRWFCEGRIRLLDDGRVEVARARRAAGALISPASET